MSWLVRAIFCHNWLMTLLFHNCKANCPYTRIDTLLPYYIILGWATLKIQIGIPSLVRPFHNAKNRCPTTCMTAKVTPKRSLFGIPIRTSLKRPNHSLMEKWHDSITLKSILVTACKRFPQCQTSPVTCDKSLNWLIIPLVFPQLLSLHLCDNPDSNMWLEKSIYLEFQKLFWFPCNTLITTVKKCF